MADYLHGAYGHLDASIVRKTVASETVPVYFGTAPVGLVRGCGGAVNVPVKISSLADAQAKIGHSENFADYTLCEAVAAHFDTGMEAVGPIYAINVLDPGKHRKPHETAKTLVFSHGRAAAATDSAILDTFRIERPALGGKPQACSVRPTGKAGDNPSFDYSAAYTAAGVTFKGGLITYKPTGKIAAELRHDGTAYIGIVFDAPKSATAATMTINGKKGEKVNLSPDSDNVVGGKPIEYFAFADESGAPMEDSSWVVEIDWEGGDTPKTCTRISRGTADYIEGKDYELTYAARTGEIVVSSIDGSIPDGEAKAHFYEMDPAAVKENDLIGAATESGDYSGIAALPLLYQDKFVIPNLLAAPGWSHSEAVYNALVAASAAINGHWDAFVLADLPLVDSESQAVDTIDKAIKWKAEHGYDSERSMVCWPMAVDKAGRRFHASTLAAAASQRTDIGNGGVPFESPSNKQVDVCGQFFGGNSRNRGFDQQTANRLNERGITTVVGWAGAWVLWGPHTAAYESGGPTVDPRAYFTTNMRMLMHITNSFQQEWSPEIDGPMTRAMKDRIVNREQEKLDALVTVGALIGESTIAFNETKNQHENLIEGDFVFNIVATPTPPMKSVTAYVAYSDDGFDTFFEGVA